MHTHARAHYQHNDKHKRFFIFSVVSYDSHQSTLSRLYVLYKHTFTFHFNVKSFSLTNILGHLILILYVFIIALYKIPMKILFLMKLFYEQIKLVDTSSNFFLFSLFFSEIINLTLYNIYIWIKSSIFEFEFLFYLFLLSFGNLMNIRLKKLNGLYYGLKYRIKFHVGRLKI